ncbi:TetR/AcrR family transcriptional regulator [Kribbella sp. NBC_01245]|uniref:TetR/AcrR family transcriptional regulator n=1 Tax=Kribbella sp. NBC_01245 TaxID=2903578 RepID=UPI002E2C08A5|nr:TetR family transcriptional regulator [Kribbella sp. NBC_01245]
MARPRTIDDEVVLEATRRVLAERGPAGLTLAAVGKLAGLAPSTLMQRFGSKRGLLLASAARSVGAARQAFAQAEARNDSPLAALRDAAISSVVHIDKREHLGNGLGFVQLDVNDAEFRTYAMQNHAAIVDGCERLLRAAQAAGELEREVDPAELAKAVLVMFQGALIIWAVNGWGTLTDFLSGQLDQLLAPHRPSAS